MSILAAIRSETIWSSTRGTCPIMLSHPSSMTENDGKLRKLGRHGPYCILLHSACEVRHDVQHNYSRFSTDLWQPQLGAYRVNSMDCGLTNVSPALIPEFCFPLTISVQLCMWFGHRIRKESAFILWICMLCLLKFIML